VLIKSSLQYATWLTESLEKIAFQMNGIYLTLKGKADATVCVNYRGLKTPRSSHESN